MEEKMYEEIIERLDKIEKKLDEILLRLPLPIYTATYSPEDGWDYLGMPPPYPLP